MSVDRELARVRATDAARALVRALAAEHGPLLFHQSGGCCDGSAPMCYPRAEFKLGARDVLLGWVEGTPYFIGGDQFDYWRHTGLVLDVVKGRGAGFSLEAPEGVRFIIRSIVLSSEEIEVLDSEPLRLGEAALEHADPSPRG
jgi:uncharacterized protein